jgi:hypothetical protein
VRPEVRVQSDAIAAAAVIEMALLNCTHVVAASHASSSSRRYLERL